MRLYGPIKQIKNSIIETLFLIIYRTKSIIPTRLVVRIVKRALVWNITQDKPKPLEKTWLVALVKANIISQC
jgi:hypothetical protein